MVVLSKFETENSVEQRLNNFQGLAKEDLDTTEEVGSHWAGTLCTK